MPLPAAMHPYWLCQQCSWQHIIQMYLWLNIHSECYKLHFRGSYPGPYSNAFRLITGEVRYFRLICLCWPEFGLYSLTAVRPEDMLREVKTRSHDHILFYLGPVMEQSGDDPPWEGRRGSAGLSCAGTPSAPWLGTASPEPGLRLHVWGCFSPRAVVELLSMNKHLFQLNELNQAKKQFPLWQSLLERKNGL